MSDEAHLIDKQAVAAMLGVTIRQVERYTAEADNPLPITVRAAKGSRMGHRYDIRAVHEWAIARMIDGGSGEVLNLEQERAKLARAQRQRQEMVLAKERGEVVEVEAVADEVGREYDRVRALLLALPSKAAPMVAHEQSLAACRVIIEKMVREALTELSAPDAIGEASNG